MTELDTVNGTKVYLNDDGKFQATVNGELVVRSSLSALKAALRSSNEPLKSFRVNSFHEPEAVDVIGVESGRIRIKGRLLQPYDHIYFWDDAAVQQLTDIAERYDQITRQLDDEAAAVLKGCTRVTAESLKKARKQAKP